MTLPKTHPLYGAIDALGYLKHHGTTPEIAIRTLEAAGYRVVGPEPTDEMMAKSQGWRCFDIADHWPEAARTPYGTWRAMHAAAPTITETETNT